jgi:hypothetical protein
MAAAVPGLLKACFLFGTMMGSLSVVYGENILAGPTIFIPKSESSALADSHIRYTGAIMASAGAIGWWASNDVAERTVPLAIVSAGAFAGGLARIFAGLKHGFHPRMKLAMWLELVIPVSVYTFGKIVGQW